MKRFLTAAIGLLVLAACNGGDGPTNNPTLTSISISPDGSTLTVGQTVTLSATGHMSDGGTSNVSATFTSQNQAVATVTAAGVVTAVSAGTAQIQAEYQGKTDLVTITVTGQVVNNCTPANTLNLAVGQSQVLAGAAGANICLGAGGANAEYTVMPHFTTPASASLALSVQASGGVVAVTGPPNPSLAVPTRFSAAFAAARAAARDRGRSFHVDLRERTARAMVGHVAGAQRWYRERKTLRRNVQGAPPALGALLQINVSQSFCTNIDYRTGRVVAIGNRAVVVEDTANPKPGFTTEDFENIAATFDTLVYPVAVANFGEPQDIDDNDRVIIFYTRAVNELTPVGQNFIVGGFFYGRDLFPHQAGNGFPACEGSNVGEMFYMLAADPTGVVNGHVRTVESVLEGTIATVAHEFQHLISASRRLFVIGAGGTSWSEDAFLNEGLSHIAEELLFYRASGLGPRQNIDYPTITANQQRIDAANTYQIQNIGRFLEFLEDPEGNSVYDDDDDLATRGGSWAFLRYAADRRNGNDAELWFNLVNTDLTGLANLQSTLAIDPRIWVRDFNVSLYADDAVAGVPPEYRQPSWDHRSIYSGIPAIGGYPLRVRPLAAGATVNVTLVGGSASFLRVGVAANGQARVDVLSGGVAPPNGASVVVLRTK
ncbi:MAG TPA: Ig-like domain-containing protein [Longimicrobiaceae bacterium]|nr:Ig-like domain-containing protein [Longimicrobiaceae bacterium]